MAKTWASHRDEWVLPLAWIVGAITTVGCLFLMLLILAQPTVYPNPGLASSTPPPGTRLIPLPRKSDAPELVDLPLEPASPLTALALAQPVETQAKPDARPPARKRARAALPEDIRALGYGQQEIYESRGSSSTRAYSGGPKS
jgi:hypothetical protein